MRNIAQRDTVPEVRIRRLFHARGLRYRLHYPIDGMRSKPDVAFVSARLAIYVDGCFWHGCKRHGTRPKRNADAWAAKISANRERDVRVSRELQERGWSVLRFCAGDEPSAILASVLSILASTGELDAVCGGNRLSLEG